MHGGYIAAAFDEVLGSTQSLSGSPGMTGRLTVHYRKPTPLQTELQFEGWIESVDGRKILTKGELRAGEVLCAEAEGLFISIKTDQFVEMRAERDRRQAGSSLAAVAHERLDHGHLVDEVLLQARHDGALDRPGHEQRLHAHVALAAPPAAAVGGLEPVGALALEPIGVVVGEHREGGGARGEVVGRLPRPT